MADGATTVPPHRRLREATADAHTATEAVPVMQALLEGRLDTAGYAALLQAQYRLHRGWESAQHDWLAQLAGDDWVYHARAGALMGDLHALGVRLPPSDAAEARTGAPAIWGELYVIEGSALGGQLIARQLARLRPDLPHAFFSLGVTHGHGSWRRFQALLDRALAAPAALDAAIAAALSMFGRFRAAFEGLTA